MPVDSRIRAALAEQAAGVRVDAEQPLQQVHQRRTRRLAALWAGAAAAVVVAVGAAAVMVPDPGRPEPAGPVTGEPADPAYRPFPLGSYVREVTSEEALADGFSRAEVRHLFDGDERVRVLMEFRRESEKFASRRNGWAVWFVDQDYQRRIRDGGSFHVDEDGRLTILSKWIDCLGCSYHFDWDADRSRLSLDTAPATQPRAMAALLDGGTWRRQRE